MSRTVLRVVLVILSLIPITTGLLAIIVGTTGLPEQSNVSATVDSEYRFVNVFWLAAGVALLWSTFDMTERRAVTRVMLALAALGGLVRMWSVIAAGWPHPFFIATIALELVVVPLVLWWHTVVVPCAADPSARSVDPSAR